MKLIIQIPCKDEQDQLPATLADLPRDVDGFDSVEWLVIDDGSTDRTVEVARANGVDHIVKLTNNKGLAAGFQAGLDACLKLGADVIVNTDADNQYYGGDIPKLVAPILEGRADMVVGDRETDTIEHFSPLKKRLQRLGSAVVRRASNTTVPDTTSGFRAYNREAALQLVVVSRFTYTLETIIQAGKTLVAVDHVPIRTNEKTRESRLFPSMWSYVRRNSVVDLPRLRAVRAAARVHDRRGRGGAAGRRHLGPLPLLLLRRLGPGPRAVADPGLDAADHRRAVRGAGRDRRHPGRQPDAAAAHAGAGAAGGAARSAWSPRTTSRPPTRARRTTGADAGPAPGEAPRDRVGL